MKNKKGRERMPDDLNPDFLFSGASMALLVQGVNGEFSFEHLARARLADAGLDCNSGEWIGFAAAARQLHTWESAK